MPRFHERSTEPAIRLELAGPRPYNRTERNSNEKLHFTNRSGSSRWVYLSCPRLPPPLNPKHVRGGFTVALKVSLHKSPAMYRAQALRGGPNIKAACNKT